MGLDKSVFYGIIVVEGRKAMANKRKMACGKEYLAIGMEGSMADLHEQYLTCHECEYHDCCQDSKDK